MRLGILRAKWGSPGQARPVGPNGRIARAKSLTESNRSSLSFDSAHRTAASSAAGTSFLSVERRGAGSVTMATAAATVLPLKGGVPARSS
jgi:hypothetical protein